MDSKSIKDLAAQRLRDLERTRKDAALADARKTIKAAREAQQKAIEAAPATEKKPEPLPFIVDEDPQSIIPYEIIATITQFENIYETRLFGWCLAKAQSVLKLYNKDLKDINLQHALDVTRITLPARLLLNPGDKNYGNIAKAFTLSTKQIHYTKNNREYWLNIVAFPEIRTTDTGKKELTFVMHREVWHALLDFSHGHRLFNLPTYIRLTSKYSVIMYLLCSQQDSNPKSYGITKLRTLLGCQQLKGYDRGNNFVQKVLVPARLELMAKAPFYFDYSLTKTGSAGRITEVVLIPRPNTNYNPTTDTTRTKCNELRMRLDPEVRRYCVESFGIETRPLEKIEHLIIGVGEKVKQMEKLATIKEAIALRRIKNPAGYFTRAVKNWQQT